MKLENPTNITYEIDIFKEKRKYLGNLILKIVKKYKNTDEFIPETILFDIYLYAKELKEINYVKYLLSRCNKNISQKFIHLLNEHLISQGAKVSKNTTKKQFKDINFEPPISESYIDEEVTTTYVMDTPTHLITTSTLKIDKGGLHIIESSDDNYNHQKNWKIIKASREENINNPNYPSVHSLDFKNGKFCIYVKVGNFKNPRMSLEDVYMKFKDNQLLMNELKNLLRINLDEDINLDKILSKCSKRYYEIYRRIPKFDYDINKMRKEIDETIENIISKLNLTQSDDVIEQLKCCCLVQKYIVENIKYTENIMQEKSMYSAEDIRTIDLYNAVIKNIGVCSSNSIMFQEILSRIGINVECVGLLSNKGGYHMANLVQLDGKYYFFDSTLEKSIYDSCAKENQELILCCAGLGTSEYCEHYVPQAIVPTNPLERTKKVPHNISKYRIPPDVINSFITKSPKK